MLLALVARGSAAASPLREAATHLACGDLADATEAVGELTAAPLGGFGLPDETLTAADDELASVEYDNLLDALATARMRFTQLAPRVDALIARWDFCALTADGERWDLQLRDGKIFRRRPARMSPLMGRGFAAWGLLPRAARGRPRWQADAEASRSLLAVPQCQGQASIDFTPQGPLPAIGESEAALDTACEGPPAIAPTSETPPTETAAAPPPRPARRVAARIKPSAVPIETPPESSAALNQDAAAPIPGTLSVSLVVTPKGNVSSVLGVSLAPRRNTFTRVGLTWRWLTAWEEGVDLEPSWSWGVGYDDWRTGTFSLQLNNWGPLRRTGGERALTGAVLSLGYKVPLPKALGRYLSLRSDLSTPLSWSPAIGAGLAFKLPHAFFVSFGVSKKLLESTPPTWSYVIGRSRWKPGTLSVILANYGPNQLDELRLRGVTLTLSWSWSLR